MTRPYTPSATASSRRRRWSDAQRRAAALLASGGGVCDVAREVGVGRQTVSRWKADPGFAALLDAEVARARAAAEREIGLAAPAAVRALRRLVEASDRGEPGVDSGEALRAAQTLLAAASPPSERMRREARAEVLRALPVGLRRQVAAALDAAGVDLEALEALDDDALAALAGGRP